MSFAAGYVLGLTVVALLLFSTDRMRVDVASILLLLLLTLPQPLVPELLTAREAVAGFGSETIVVIAALFMLTEGIVRTGVVERFGLRLARLGREKPGAIGKLLLVSAAALSAFISNTLTTAIHVPLVMSAAKRSRLSASKLLMPIAFASIMTGSLTMIGTSTNLVVAGSLASWGLEPMGFFELTPVAAVVAVLGMLYLLLVAPRLLHDAATSERSGGKRRNFGTEVVVGSDSPLAGKTLAQLNLSDVLNVFVVGIRRARRVLRPRKHETLREGDELIVAGSTKDILSIKDVEGIDLRPELTHAPENATDEASKIIEAMVLPRSALAGRTLGGMRFSQATGFTVLGLHSARPFTGSERLSQRRLQAGDVLMIKGRAEDLEFLPEGLVPLDDVSGHHPRSAKGPLATLLFVASIAVGATGWLELPVAFLLGVLLMIALGCLTPEEAYGSVEWPLLVLIGAMFAFGTALEKSGASSLLATWLVQFVSPLGPTVVLTGFCLLTVFLSQPMSNQAAVLLVCPIVLQTAHAMQVDPRQWIMGVTLAASCSFMTPLEPACLLVVGPGRYRYSDFMRVGLPLTVIVLVAIVLLAPLRWPL